MARTSIVTDSTSGLSPEEVKPLGIAIIPAHIEMDARTYREGVDLSLSEFYQRVDNNSALPRTSPPTAREFRDLFRRLAREADEIVAIHVSSHLNATVNTARQAGQSYLGRARVSVVDSRLAAAPLGWLATAAAEAAAAGVDTPEIIRLLRAMIPRMYIAFHSETAEYSPDLGLVQRAPTAAAPPSAKPLLILEEGQIMPFERTRSRGRAVDRLFQFVTEFSRLERIAILQGKPLPEALELATLINEELPDQPVETRMYPPSVAAHVGSRALGVAVYEGIG